MNYVQVGRCVSPVLKSQRTFKAVIVGIIDSKFVVVVKPGKEYEVVPVTSLTLLDEVVDIKNIKDDELEKVLQVNGEKKMNDFERFKKNLKENIQQQVLNENGF